MKDKIVFIDTNIFAYAIIDDESEKHYKALSFLENLDSKIYISPQIVNELYNVLQKHKYNDKKIQSQIKKIINTVSIKNMTLKTIEKSWFIKNKYKFSIWDSSVIASALESSSSVLYSEDMQDNQIIEKSLKIINPLK